MNANPFRLEEKQGLLTEPVQSCRECGEPVRRNATIRLCDACEVLGE